ncbi:DUF2865 domain-containing protein [Rhizobium mesoamericanum]|uniref:DUF2865 domain-containing protein n=1 Tax=Rhizobium mesoamericanum STM3625 TaxID=1211777 RepID=K0PPQ4_9HYPH|nr:DUF2865 domain-containing protein [Rhizobium mesoamericanum]CCM75858.1 conserved exported hypothetical protein [Rhizobium mesoamericanum STM3625]
MNRWILSLATALALTSPTQAQMPGICGDLRARLADLPQIIGSTPEVRKFAGAIAEQNLELRKLRSDLRQNGCTSGSMVVIGDDDGYCGELERAETKMVDNIHYLQQRRDELRGQSDDVRTRNELLAALDDNGCNEEQWPEDRADGYSPPPSIEDQAMRNDTFIPLGSGPNQRRYGFGMSTLSHLNTVCVRTCDGGFFPLSSNATSQDFVRDADTCAKMCPGIDTELFYRDVSSTETSQMISAATGAPYSAMPNAFAYKNRKPGEKSSCSCNLNAYYEEMRKSQSIGEPPQQGSITTIQTKKPEPESKVVAPAAPRPQVEDRPYDPGKVRQIGPQFLAGDQGTIDLKNPAKPGPQPQQQ